MKKLIFILMVGSLFGQNQTDYQDLTQTEKMLLYNSQKKKKLLEYPIPKQIPSS